MTLADKVLNKKSNKKEWLLDIMFKQRGHHGHEGLQGQRGGSAPEGMTAGTASEAENIAKEHFVENADFSGLGVDACNQINHALTANDDIDFEENPIKVIKAEVIGTANAAVDRNGEILINPHSMANAERFNETCKHVNGHDRYQQTTQEDINEAESEMEELQEQILEEIPEEDHERAKELIEEGHGQGRLARMETDTQLNNLMGHEVGEPFEKVIIDERTKYAEVENLKENIEEDNFARQWRYETVNDVITHEIGHELTRRNLEEKGLLEEAYGTAPDANELAEAVPEWDEDYNVSNWDDEEHMEYKLNISEYSSATAHEYIAESYLAYKRGDEIHPDMESFIEEELINGNQ